MRLLGQFQTFYIFFHNKISQVQKSTKRFSFLTGAVKHANVSLFACLTVPLLLR